MKIAVNDEVYLTEIRPPDRSAFLEHLRDKEIYDRTLRIPYPYTEADADAWLALVEKANRDKGPFVAWAIRDAKGFMIGAGGFEGPVAGKAYRAEIGYWLARPFRGRGIMTAVVQKACAYAFAEFGLGKIIAVVFADNRGSFRVLEKCGFQLEGYLHKHFLKDGRRIDAKLYALLKD